MTTDLSPEDVARWMLKEVEEQRQLYRRHATSIIQEKFGGGFIRLRDGKPTIHPKILKAFDRLNGNRIVYYKGERVWRLGFSDNRPGQSQD